MSLLHLTLACGEPLQVHRFSVLESVSSPFLVKVLARSPDPSIDFKAILGSPAALSIEDADRAWSGVCNSVRLVQAVDTGLAEVGLSTYELTIVPRLWLLSHRTSYRIFQHVSIPGIVRAVLEGWGLQAEWRDDSRHRRPRVHPLAPGAAHPQAQRPGCPERRRGRPPGPGDPHRRARARSRAVPVGPRRAASTSPARPDPTGIERRHARARPCGSPGLAARSRSRSGPPGRRAWGCAAPGARAWTRGRR